MGNFLPQQKKESARRGGPCATFNCVTGVAAPRFCCVGDRNFASDFGINKVVNQLPLWNINKHRITNVFVAWTKKEHILKDFLAEMDET